MLESIAAIGIEVIKWVIPIIVFNGFIYLRHYHKVKRHLRAFFNNFDREETILIIPPADIDPVLKETQVFDFLGAMELQDMFSRLGYKLKRVRADKIAEDELKHNLVSVSGPIPNKVTRFLLNQNEIVYAFGGSDGHSIINKSNSEKRFDPWKKDGVYITRDFGMITKMKNPYNPDKDVIIACGSFGWGTQAALRILADPVSLKYLNSFGQYFQILCTCGVDEDKVGLKPYLVDLCPDDSLRQETIVNLYNKKGGRNDEKSRK